jgi:O-antigen/teichoic acid export membrane protein
MLAQKLILSYSTRIFVQIIQIIASIVVARVAGPTVLGTVAFGFAYVSIFSFIADLGLGTAHIKLISEGKDFGKCLSTFAVLKSIVTGCFILIVTGFFFFEKYIANRDFESQEHIYVIFIMLITVTIGQFTLIPNTTFMARTEQAKQDIPDFIQTLTLQIFRIILVLLGFGAVALALGQLVALILVLPIIFYLMKGFKFGEYDKDLAKSYIKIALPVILIGMTSNIASYVDVYILQLFTDSEQVGYYSAGYRVGGFVLMIANSIGLLFFPLFSQAFAKGDLQFIRDKINKFERFSYIFIMPPVILLAVYSELIVKVLLGDQYFASIAVMSTITLAMFAMVLVTPYGNVLTGMGKFNLTAKLNVAFFLFFTAILIIFVSPSFLNLKAAGVALAVFFSKIFLGALYIFYAKKSIPILKIAEGIKFILAGIILYYLFNYVYQNYLQGDILIKIIFIPVFLLFVYLVFFLLKWFKKEDMDSLKTLVDFKSINKYIKGEFKRT